MQVGQETLSRNRMLVWKGLHPWTNSKSDAEFDPCEILTLDQCSIDDCIANCLSVPVDTIAIVAIFLRIAAVKLAVQTCHHPC